MSYRLELTDGALEDLAAAAQWYQQNSQTAGGALVQAIEDILYEIRERPETWPRLASHPQIRVRVIPRLRYRVLYQIIESTVVVHAIAHTSRHPDYWIDRVK